MGNLGLKRQRVILLPFIFFKFAFHDLGLSVIIDPLSPIEENLAGVSGDQSHVFEKDAVAYSLSAKCLLSFFTLIVVVIFVNVLDMLIVFIYEF